MAKGAELEKPAREIVDRGVGEIVNLDDADNQRLAEVITHTIDLRRELGEVEQLVSDELISRLDLDANWTWRGDGVTVTAASPERGSEDFPVDALETALQELIDKGVISREAAEKAVKRRITLQLDVPLGASMRELLEKFKEWTISFDDIEMPVVKADGTAEKVAGGIKALRKNPKAKPRLDKAAVKVTPPVRRVKVSSA